MVVEGVVLQPDASGLNFIDSFKVKHGFQYDKMTYYQEYSLTKVLFF